MFVAIASFFVLLFAFLTAIFSSDSDEVGGGRRWEKEKGRKKEKGGRKGEGRGVNICSWNVMSNLVSHFFLRGFDENPEEIVDRGKYTISVLDSMLKKSDVIALQEVTPDFMTLYLKKYVKSRGLRIYYDSVDVHSVQRQYKLAGKKVLVDSEKIGNVVIAKPRFRLVSVPEFDKKVYKLADKYEHSKLLPVVFRDEGGEGRGGKEIVIVNCHLAARDDEVIDKILDIYEDLFDSGSVLYLVGDMNCTFGTNDFKPYNTANIQHATSYHPYVYENGEYLRTSNKYKKVDNCITNAKIVSVVQIPKKGMTNLQTPYKTSGDQQANYNPNKGGWPSDHSLQLYCTKY